MATTTPRTGKYPRQTKQDDPVYYYGDLYKLRCKQCGRTPKWVLSPEAFEWPDEAHLRCCGVTKVLRVVSLSDIKQTEFYRAK